MILSENWYACLSPTKVYVTGLEVEQLSAEVSSLSSEISVDDNAFILLRIKNNVRGSIWVSSAATGGEND